MAGGRTDGRIERGNQTRRLILRRTVEIASVEGLEGLSLGRLAGELNLSKSGVFALFGSKEELQLATVRAAINVFLEQVVTPARRTPPGVARVWELCRLWLVYSEQRVFPGGCFFYSVSAEFDARPGPVHDTVVGAQVNWRAFVEQAITEGIEAGDIAADTDVTLLAFELIAFLELANGDSVLRDDSAVYRTATTAILRRLRAVATDPSSLPDVP
ncbi:TetR/AcrR family transcriptional regulator [Peterkaempfera sp. SMS 1(5)a]|uniref:TetR/AcrR family transcriptional regulator n=1 Tax=Peterkaempfera podocarpi TaxID=3232308 RepID=UPI00366CADE3